MTRTSSAPHPAQLGFDSMLSEAEAVNKTAALERAYGHLPGTMEEAIPFYRDLIERHHAAMLASDIDTVMALRKEAGNLALWLNNGEPGILAGPDAPGYKLAALTAAPDGTIPLWGQNGSFLIETHGIRVGIEMDGIFGIGASYMPWMNFSAHAVDWDIPFISETGYRSFMGLHAALVPGMTPDGFARDVITSHIRQTLKGKLRPIDERYRPEAANSAGSPKTVESGR